MAMNNAWVRDQVVTPQTEPLTEERFWQLWAAAKTPAEHYMLFRGYETVNSAFLREQAERVDASSRIPYLKAAVVYRTFAINVAAAYAYALRTTSEGDDQDGMRKMRDTALMFAMQRAERSGVATGQILALLTELDPISHHFRLDPYARALCEFLRDIRSCRDTEYPKYMALPIDAIWLEVVMKFGLKDMFDRYIASIGGKLDPNGQRAPEDQVVEVARKVLIGEGLQNKKVTDILSEGWVEVNLVLSALMPLAARRGLRLDELLHLNDGAKED